MEIQSETGLSLMAQPTTREAFDAQLVTKTIDHMNTNSKSGVARDADYDFQKTVLSGAYLGESSIINKLV